MANLDTLLKKKRNRNYISCLLVTKKVGKALGPFTEDKLQNIHGQIVRTLGAQNACTDQCSQQFKNNFNRWCITCTTWRAELLRFHLFPRKITWSELKSWEWPNNPKHISEVFMIQGFNKTNLNLEDVTVSLNIWKRCSEFPRSLIPMADAVRGCRNQLCHDIFECDDNLKTEVFANIKKLIHHKDLSPLIPDIVDLCGCIRDLEKDQLNAYKQELENIIKGRLTDVETQVSMLSNICYMVMFVVCFSTVLYFWSSNTLSPRTLAMPRMRTSEIGECVTEDIYGDFPNPLRLEAYLKRHKKLVGREWLFDMIKKSIQTMNPSTRGLVMKADMGYGKSAFVAHTVCAVEHSKGYRLRKMIIAFHVCKFDVLLTQKPGLFIRRLTSMISHFVPELMTQLLRERQCFEYYNGEFCNEDYLGCIDICLINPLQALSRNDFTTSLKLIIIDAIDECGNSKDASDNAIIEIIRKRFHLFPTWIKLLMTSRKLRQHTQLMLDFDVIYLHTLEKRNLQDVHSYLNRTEINRLDMPSTFLIAQYMVDSNGYNDSNIKNRFYFDQFERIFGDEFQNARTIFEVTVTTFLTKTKHNILKVIKGCFTMHKDTLNDDLEKVEQFFIIVNDTVTFTHQSVVNWLENKASKTFKIQRKNGHTINAQYLLNQIDNMYIIDTDIVNLAIHIMNSEATELIDRFKNISHDQITLLERTYSESPLIRCVKRPDCSNIPETLYYHINKTEELSSENFTAAYIAAATGKLSALKSLCDYGAYVNFRVKSYHGTMLADVDVAVQIATLMKQWGYGLLDIASQNGHVQIVNFILTDNTFFGNYTYHILNGINLKPVHLACKSGYVDAVKEFYIYNKGSVDWQCLYFAADGGHLSLVSYLVNELNITDMCLECNEVLTWLSGGCSRMQGRKVDTVCLYDDWGDLSCESALHAAIRGDNVKIMKAIISNNGGSTLGCLDRGGRPPLLVAIQNNRKDMVSYILENHKKFANVSYSCGNATEIKDKLQLNIYEEDLLNSQICKAGFRLEDVVAEQGDLWTFKDFNEHGIYLDFFTRDTNGCFTAHSAACNGNIRLLYHLIYDQNTDIMTLRCNNMSTPLHSAIICQNNISFHYIRNHVDSANIDLHRFRLTYMWLAVKQTPFSSDPNKQPLSSIILNLYSILPDTINASDHFGRNPLHYLIQNGHSKVLNTLFQTHGDTVEALLTRTDNLGQTPIMFSVRRLSKRKSFAVLNDHFNLETDFQLSDLLLDQRLLTQSECTFFVSLQFGKLRNLLTSPVKTRILEILIKKRTFYLFQMCLSHIVDEHERYQTYVLKSIVENDSFGLFLASYYRKLALDIETYVNHKFYHNLESNKLFVPFLVCNNCDSLIKSCLIHKMIYKLAEFERIHSLYYKEIVYPEITSVAKIVFKSVNSSVLTFCKNEHGQNVLDVAIQQKSVMFTTYFLDKGVSPSFSHESVLSKAIKTSVSQENRQVILFTSISNGTAREITFLKFNDILTILNRSSTEDTNVIFRELLLNNVVLDGSFLVFQGNVTDSFIAFYIQTFYSSISRIFICDNYSTKFSFIHLLALHNFMYSIQSAAIYFGKDILDCRNKDNFTPAYLALVFGRENKTFDYIQSNIYNKRKIIYPDKYAEQYLVYKISTTFSNSNSLTYKLQCRDMFFRNRRKVFYHYIKVYNCLKSFSLFTLEYFKEIKMIKKGLKASMNSISFYYLQESVNKIYVYNSSSKLATRTQIKTFKFVVSEVCVYLVNMGKMASAMNISRSFMKYLTPIKYQWIFEENIHMIEDFDINACYYDTDFAFETAYLFTEMFMLSYNEAILRNRVSAFLKTEFSTNIWLSNFTTPFMLKRKNMSLYNYKHHNRLYLQYQSKRFSYLDTISSLPIYSFAVDMNLFKQTGYLERMLFSYKFLLNSMSGLELKTLYSNFRKLSGKN